ncbi:hypothetical protein L9F63_011413, partial [Diploptera punctata]
GQGTLYLRRYRLCNECNGLKEIVCFVSPSALPYYFRMLRTQYVRISKTCSLSIEFRNTLYIYT